MLMGAARTVLLGCLMVGAACATTNNSSFDRRALQSDSCADLNGDGEVSVTDLLTVRQPTRLARVTATDGPANP